MILLQLPDPLDRMHEGRRRAADGAYGRYEITRRNTGDLRRDSGQPCDREMTEDTVEAKRYVHRRIGFQHNAPVRPATSKVKFTPGMVGPSGRE